MITHMPLHTARNADFTYAGLHITMNETWQKLLFNGRTIPLTPTEYRLCVAFFQQYLSENKKPIMHHDTWIMLSYINTTKLQMRIGLASKQLLRKHISNTNGKLAPFALQIKTFEQGYILLINTPQES